MKMKLITAVVASIGLSACATITKGTKNTVQVASSPNDAKVLFQDTAQKRDPQTCQTPCEIELKRKSTYKTTVSKEGYENFIVIIEPKVSTSGGTAFAGNLLIGGIIGAGVDAATGAAKDLTPNNLTVTLAPSGGTSFATDGEGERVENFDPAFVPDEIVTSSDDGSEPVG